MSGMSSHAIKQASTWLQQAEQLLSSHYAEPHRAYHNARHVQALLHLLDAHQPLVKDHTAVALAIWFHDAVYDTARQDNEEQSAQLAEQALPTWACPPELISKVAGMVRATQHHQWSDGDPDTAAFLDFDLGILAAPAEAYERYSDQIRQEYTWVPDAAYRSGRAKVLSSFLQRERIYFTEALCGVWEAQARANLSRELVALNA
jgi:predicted metal-dependent HD superfamily phosphohydrolase